MMTKKMLLTVSLLASLTGVVNAQALSPENAINKDTFRYSVNANKTKAFIQWGKESVGLPVKVTAVQNIAPELISVQLNSDPLQTYTKMAQFSDEHGLRLVVVTASPSVQSILGHFKWSAQKVEGQAEVIYLSSTGAATSVDTGKYLAPQPWLENKPVQVSVLMKGEKQVSSWCLARGALLRPTNPEDGVRLPWVAYRTDSNCK